MLKFALLEIHSIICGCSICFFYVYGLQISIVLWFGEQIQFIHIFSVDIVCTQNKIHVIFIMLLYIVESMFLEHMCKSKPCKSRHSIHITYEDLKERYNL